MTFYKAISKQLKANATALGMKFYPVQAPQNAADPYCVFTLIDDNTAPVHNGGYDNGEALVQFEVYCKTLATLDARVDGLKNHFIGQTIEADTTVTLCYCNVQSEIDAFENDEQMYNRSLDIRIRYILRS